VRREYPDRDYDQQYHHVEKSGRLKKDEDEEGKKRSKRPWC